MPSPKWETRDPADPILVRVLSQELGISALVASLLVSRGISDPGEADDFLHPRLASLPDPLATPGIEQVARRIISAIRNNENVILFGDYDVDGVTSLTILHRFLASSGLHTNWFLPQRQNEGYGLSFDGLDRIFATSHPSLVIALDCGTSSCKEAEWLAEQGTELLIVDHHEPKDGGIARCSGLVNPKAVGGNTDLCTAALVFKLCHGIQKISGERTTDLRDFLDLAAMGTICDLTPLRGENRIIVRHGLARLSQSKWKGLRALIDVGSVVPPITSAEVGFRLGPRLNASGRLNTAENSLRLLLTEDDTEARSLSQYLDQCNRDRQTLEQKVLNAAIADLEASFQPDRDCAIVVAGDGWHNGVVGIVASRLSKKYFRPALVIGFDENGEGHGSGRSIEGLSLIETLGDCMANLGPFGGHHMAAGLSVHRDNFDIFRKQFLEAAARRLSVSDLVPRLRLDTQIDISDVNFGHLEELSLLEPFGMANPAPIFYTRNITPTSGPDTLKEKHIRFRVRGRDDSLAAIYFNGASENFPKAPWDVAFKIVRNEYRQQITIQLEVQHLRSTSN